MGIQCAEQFHKLFPIDFAQQATCVVLAKWAILRLFTTVDKEKDRQQVLKQQRTGAWASSHTSPT